MAEADPLTRDILIDADHARQDATRISGLLDEVAVRLSFGLTGFNAASMVALVSAAGAAPGLMKALGISSLETFTAVCFFAVGTICGGVSVFSTHTELFKRSGYANARAINLMTRASAAREHKDGLFKSTAQEEIKLSGLAQERSNIALQARHLSGCAWAAGLALTLAFTFLPPGSA